MSRLEITRDAETEVWALNRPAVRNALDPQTVAALHEALQHAEHDGVRAVVITGHGPSFCAGADLAYLLDCARTGQSPRPFLQKICDLTVAMESSPVVFIAALHGHAVAGGFELALSCDLVIAATGTLIGDGHVRNNLVPGGGSSVRIAANLGTGTATWLALSGELATADSLAATGWLHAVVPAEELLLTARDMARTLSAVPAGAQRRFKTLLTADPAVTSARLERELDVFEEHWASDDVAASLNAFLTNA
ncbi:enoyl-CoA hydratase/isomerase family protein [Arthrobacter sp. ES3-54]|uniref:enoyl-CoA hydratase/isomerase family protein n=1 Tax=Arthrobacter sp. ES3-54 TaxID=1502991 RepID=UPI002404DB88|nr:enoyl-CoA hydratase/isomerase family protein [Arthrobacter sp. ES3-54]MDF9749593.1 enoyl-CoA hydratase [Arthrobacter sp. ES3-54]